MGYVLDSTGAPIAGSAQLKREFGRVVLEVMWDGASGSVFNTWFPPFFHMKDDQVPPTIKFFDGQGTNVLFPMGSPARQVVQIGGSQRRSDQKASIDISHVVHHDDSYSCIRGLKSETEALVDWVGATVLETNIRFENGGLKINSYHPTKPETIEIGTVGEIEVALSPELYTTGFKFNSKNQIVLTSRTSIITKSKYIKNWNAHLQVHRRVRDLLAVSSIGRIDFVNKHSFYSPQDNGNWKPLTTNLTGVKSTDVDHDKPKFAFNFQEIGPEGVLAWLQLWENGYGRGLRHFVTGIRSAPLTVEDECVSVGIALEHIGFQIAVDRGVRKEKADNLKHWQKVREVVNDIPKIAGLNSFDWCQSMSDSYNSLKHNRDEPQPIEIVHRDTQSALKVLRAWVSNRICDKPIDLYTTRDDRLKINWRG